MTVSTARDYFMHIYKTSDANEDKQVIPQIAEDTIRWLRDGLSDEEKREEITKEDFVKAVISSLLFSIKHELGMDYFLLQSRDKDEVFCKIFVNDEWLRKHSIDLGYQLQFKSKVKHTLPFQEVPPYGSADLTKVEKNLALFKIYDEADVEVPEKGSLFTQADKARIVMTELFARIDLHALKKYGVMTEDFCVHAEAPLTNLKAKWARFGALFKPQPLDEIRAYFSEKVALYFAWIGTYLTFMIGAAVFGTLVFAGVKISKFMSDEEDGENIVAQVLQLTYAVFLSFWASGFDQYWTRKEKLLAWRWGTVNLSSQEIQRPEFKGELGRDEVTGRMKIIAIVNFKNKVKEVVSYSCILLFIMVVIIAVASIFILRQIMKESDPQSRLGTFLPAFLNAIQIRVLNLVYGKVALWLNEWENHETENLYNDNLALKLFLFKFVNSYAGLFYIAFLKILIEGEADSGCPNGCMEALGSQLIIIFMTNLSLNGLELGLPYAMWRWKMWSENRKVNKNSATDPSIRKELYKVEEDSKLAPYESPLEDYMEMCIQFGYVALFGASYPLIGLLAMIEIILEIRVDAWKLCMLTRRPDPNRSETIGVWKKIVVCIAYFGAISNSGIVVYTSGLFNAWDSIKLVILFIALEHLLIGGMYSIGIIVPDVPQVVIDGGNWSNRIVTEKRLSWKETAEKVKAEFNTSTGLERFMIEPKDIKYHDE